MLENFDITLINFKSIFRKYKKILKIFEKSK